ncbi:glutamate receptor ionotropic, delta-2-like [Argiope bruennichi]|uniref:Glutamate receptor ionotropic like protein n=1 Tax=Argiope bruennichi TaxID=94029 RepID=A0A8T0EX39_ARGBR|nr:glutamate receptor ionotropic, delta-2-like [Argiope bruennichi]KAF8782915.1 Glutamate receptor ionotropic like protein [Argiope bruennichi]
MKNQSVLKVGVLPSPNYLEINRTSDGDYQISGFQGNFLGAILSALGMKYEFVVPKIPIWGHRNEDGQWIGLIGMVNRCEADMALSSIVISEDRSKAVDFSTAFRAEGMTFLIEKPGEVAPALAFLYPFEISIWICLVSFLISLPVLFQILLGGNASYGRIFLELFASILRQPWTIRGNTKKSNFLLIFWWPLAMVVSFSYSAALLSFLTVPLQGESIQNFRDLADAVVKGTHHCYALQETDVITFLFESKQPHYVTLGKAILKNNWFYSFSNVRERKHISQHSVQLISRTSAELLYGSSDVFISKDTLAIWPMGMALRRGFCCKSKVNTIILRLLSSGIPDKFLRDESFKIQLAERRKRFSTKDADVEKQLSLKDVSGAFMFLLAGYFLSFFSFLGEIIFARLHKKYS